MIHRIIAAAAKTNRTTTSESIWCLTTLERGPLKSINVDIKPPYRILFA